MWTRGRWAALGSRVVPTRDSEQEVGRRVGGRPHAPAQPPRDHRRSTDPLHPVLTAVLPVRSALRLVRGDSSRNTRNQRSGPGASLGNVGLSSGWPLPNFLSLTPPEVTTCR